MRWVQRLWAGPWTALGLVLSVLFRSRRVAAGALVAEGAAWPRKLGWRYRAMTLGHVVLCVDEVDDDLMRHELVHVRQFERWGPFFVPAYLIASLVARIRGGRAYADNHFEVAARSSGRPTPDR